jgi:hypothetical protein
MMTEVIDLEKAAQLVGAQMLPVILARGARCLVWRKQFCIGPVVVGDRLDQPDHAAKRPSEFLL